ncbi:unnamed protein product [Brassica oleracea var. botrytis]|uniref:(rape) hypothetical protein n=1 Tax=Brassica napus TaxID=3708 RepID=A0A816I3D5_BRANA|nr:unnamed protein product [Brassica napus]
MKVPMMTTVSGLQYKDIKVGTDIVKTFQMLQVTANYVAMVPSGRIVA